jgi:hypothetical protein
MRQLLISPKHAKAQRESWLTPRDRTRLRIVGRIPRRGVVDQVLQQRGGFFVEVYFLARDEDVNGLTISSKNGGFARSVESNFAIVAPSRIARAQRRQPIEAPVIKPQQARHSEGRRDRLAQIRNVICLDAGTGEARYIGLEHFVFSDLVDRPIEQIDAGRILDVKSPVPRILIGRVDRAPENTPKIERVARAEQDGPVSSPRWLDSRP